MAKEKAYKLLAIQENISNKKAKELIDRGLVTVNGKKVIVARGEVDENTIFRVEHISNIEVLFRNDDILAVNKPAFLNTSDIEKEFKDAILLNRLDKETSGVMLFALNEEFRKKAIKEFRQKKVYKEYVAIVEGKVVEEFTIDKPIYTIKGKTARSKVDEQRGKEAITHVIPYMVEGNKSKIKVIIENGRTHQIRVHLQYAGYPIIGDLQYGKPSNQVQRVMLHSKVTRIFGYEFTAKEPKEFHHFGF